MTPISQELVNSAAQTNRWYLNSMLSSKDGVLSRVRDLWWPHFINGLNADGPLNAVDQLDLYMTKGREDLFALAEKYALGKSDGDAGTAAQLRSQFLKSNTGKMFERFAGLAIAQCLIHTKSHFAILPFRNDALKKTVQLSREKLKVKLEVGSDRISTPVDADLFIYCPEEELRDVFLVSIKSTLKDRFHNVPFWNLLRRCAISGDFPDLLVDDSTLLSRLHYVAVCTDLAKEQPDFSAIGGPRNLLRFDAALLDGAYVTASKAKGVSGSLNCLGPERSSAFHKLSSLIQLLSPDFFNH